MPGGGHDSPRGERTSYGTREVIDIAYYPDSNKVTLAGSGLITRVEQPDYGDGEPED
jgi:hypothetical protein